MRRAVMFVTLLASVAGAGAVVGPAWSTALLPAAQHDSARVDAEYQRLVGELMSPFCQGLTLENCPTSGAAEMRAQIHAWLLQGQSAEQIIETLAQEWGEGILGAPRFRGLGVVAWLLPGVALAFSALVLGLWLRAQGSRRPEEEAVAEAQPASSPEIRRRIERELQTLGDH